jgi:hypothetical protein
MTFEMMNGIDILSTPFLNKYNKIVVKPYVEVGCKWEEAIVSMGLFYR